MAYARDVSQFYKEEGGVVQTTHDLSIEMTLESEIDDILVILCSVDAGRTFTVPTGWTQEYQQISSGHAQMIIWRRAEAANEVMPTLVINNADTVCAIATAYLGCPTSGSPIGDRQSDLSGGSSAILDFPSLSNTSANSLILYMATCDGNKTILSIADDPFERTSSGANAAGVGYKFYSSAETTIPAQSGTLSNADGNTATSMELLDNGVTPRIPTYFTDSPGYVTVIGDTYVSDLDIRDLFMNQDQTFEGNTRRVFTFDAATDVTVADDSLAIAIDEDLDDKRIYKLTTASGTLPTGLASEYYYFDYEDASTVKLVTAQGSFDTFAKNNVVVNVVITAIGSGTCTFTECGVMHQTLGGDRDYDRGGKNLHSHKNFVGCAHEFTPVLDLSETSFGYEQQVQLSGISDIIAVLIDSTGEWKAWKTEDYPKTTTARISKFIDPSNNTVTYSESAGTLDTSDIKHFSVFYVMAKSNSRPRMLIGHPFVLTSLTVLGGDTVKPASFLTIFDEINRYIVGTSQNPSDLQFVYLHSIQLGDGIEGINFEDSEKSLAFPPLSDGVATFDNYLVALGVDTKMKSGDSVSITNSQVGSTVAFPFTTDATTSATSSMDVGGTTFVQATAVFQSHQTIENALFIGGEGITDNNATMTGCTFDAILRAAGYINLSTTNNISSCTFKAGVSSDYAIKIDTAGTYSMDALTFTGFTASLNATHTTGTVTINILNNGDSPVLDNTWTDNGSGNFTKGSATTLIVNAVTLTVTAFDASDNSAVVGARVYLEATAGGPATVGDVILTGVTNSNGEVTDSGFNFSSSQPVSGRIRKGSGTPFYKTGILAGTIISTGLDLSAFLVGDE